nr:hypothetical protein [uncultured bacterium]
MQISPRPVASGARMRAVEPDTGRPIVGSTPGTQCSVVLQTVVSVGP